MYRLRIGAEDQHESEHQHQHEYLFDEAISPAFWALIPRVIFCPGRPWRFARERRDMSGQRLLVILLTLGFVLTGCQRPGETGDEEGEPIAEEVQESSPAEEAQTAELITVDAGPFEGAHDPSQSVAPEDYQGRLVDSVCLAYENCRNQEFKMLMFSMVVTAVGNAGLDEVASQRLIDVANRVVTSPEGMPDGDDCRQVMEIFTAVGGMEGESMVRSIEAQSLRYDPEAAGRCMARFGNPFSLCWMERGIAEELDHQEFAALMAEHRPTMDHHFQVCGDVLEGQLQAGQDCEFSYQCAGHSRCMAGQGGQKSCVQVPRAAQGGLLP